MTNGDRQGKGTTVKLFNRKDHPLNYNIWALQPFNAEDRSHIS